MVAQNADKFFQVFQPAGRLYRVVEFEHFNIAGIFENLGSQVVGGNGLHGLTPLVKLVNQVSHIGFGFAGECAVVDHFFNRHIERNAVAAGRVAKFFNGFGSDTPGRLVDNALKGQIVVWLQNNTKISQSVANFGTFIEFGTADNLIGDSFGNKLFFKFPGLESRAYEDGHLRIIVAPAFLGFDFLNDIFRFVFAAVNTDDFDFGIVTVHGRAVLGHF